MTGTMVLAAIGLWSTLGEVARWIAWPTLVGGIGLVAWGLWSRAAGRRERRRVEDLAWGVAAALGQGRPDPDAAVGDGESELAEALRRAREAVPVLSRAAAEGRGFRDVIEAVGEPVVATDEAGRVVLMNRAAERMLGVRLDGRARRIDDLIAQPEVLALHAAADEGRVSTARVRLVTGDEARVFDTTASPLGAARFPAESGVKGGQEPRGRGGVVLAFRDVTELATAVQARTDFVANASHELRTPLTAMRSAYDTLRLAIDDPRMRDRALQLAGSNLTRLEDMTRDLLDLSRVESPDAQVRIGRVDVEDVAEEAAAPFEAARAARRVGLSIEIAPEARRAETDARLVQEILRNLIDNACRFANEGTTIRVVGEAVRDVAHGPERATLRLRVIDQGIGIPLDQQARIFERFYQVDPARSGKRRGTGLGLAIVKHAARALGGSVDVESVWGQGTTMIVELPGAVVVDVAAG